jgi:hypothetical protein
LIKKVAKSSLIRHLYLFSIFHRFKFQRIFIIIIVVFQQFIFLFFTFTTLVYILLLYMLSLITLLYKSVPVIFISSFFLFFIFTGGIKWHCYLWSWFLHFYFSIFFYGSWGLLDRFKVEEGNLRVKAILLI